MVDLALDLGVICSLDLGASCRNSCESREGSERDRYDRRACRRADGLRALQNSLRHDDNASFRRCRLLQEGHCKVNDFVVDEIAQHETAHALCVSDTC